MATELDVQDPVPRPPRLRPTWTTWMWLGFAIVVLVLTVVGIVLAGKPYW